LYGEPQHRQGSVEDTLYRLGAFFPDGEVLLRDLSTRTCCGYYESLRTRKSRLGKSFSADSHRNILAEARSFLRWCSTKRRWISRNPLEEVEGVGRRKHGKAQLRVDEARRWVATAVDLADGGEEGAVAALLALVMGMRANEIVSRVARDLDDGGAALDPRLEDRGGAQEAASAGAAPVTSSGDRRREALRGEALRPSLEGLGQEMGETGSARPQGCRR
jgi:hypothetical protein